ncbi:class I SAM-dependent methyltransferase [Dactylosporangium sp. AC04546]|uniref:class I SAM-dependent methyltransferase n=1 Tax=Dactylosporangium sp. AC04546 TaxID=2862460 RepID=UPI001EE06FC0|nr:class I SAM-dependent methyltransferase [Dactylosporangium sp. AC04546]WVK81611.1 class I SAM-dependent methyltransferase [Dactylosporangium sp. AC04546]
MERFVLFPGRHHLLTRFQAEYLRGLGGTVVWAVTSANHQNTKRNPVAYDRREAAIERFSVQEGLRSLVVPVFDTAHTDRFAEVTLKSVESALGVRLAPGNTLVACSTPEVAALYEALGFEIAGVEADRDPAPARPWDVLLMLAAGDPAWRDLAHPATLDVYDRYRIGEQVALVVNDPVVGEEGGLTTTRDYRTYAEAFEASAARKWELVRRHVRPGRIVDVGCGAGAVLALADREPALRESDLIGVEVARHLYEECVHRKAQGWFSNPNVYFYCRNVLGGAVFPSRSVDTTLTFALTHEIWSYGHRLDSVRAFAAAIYEHTVPGGVWINSDVCGPDGRDRRVRLALQGAAAPAPPLDGLTRDEIAALVEALPVRARLDRFAADFHFPVPFTDHGSSVELALGDAMEFLTHKDYPDNWLSEAHEQFCGLEFADWKALLTDVGFEVDGASHAWRNDWIVDNRIAPGAELSTLDGAPLDWPVTHVLLVARRPLNT